MKDKITVEHILPQTPSKLYWRNHFRQFTPEEIKTLSASLGNLLPLSQCINSSLQNDSFDDKKARGYENGSLTPYGSEGYAYIRLGAELRYPLMLENSTSIYALGFVEAGNAWTDVAKFNPFSLKRSAGVGVRIFLPMVGMMGIDWAYGFDKINGSMSQSGSQFHFIIGQEF